MIIDHVEFPVSDAEASRRFYESALAPLGIVRIITVGPDRSRSGGTRHGFGHGGYPSLWIHDNDPPATGMHVAFTAADRNAVDAFHAAALAAGGVDNGPPAVRLHYHSNYYAAYALGPDGVNVEAVCQHAPE